MKDEAYHIAFLIVMVLGLVFTAIVGIAVGSWLASLAWNLGIARSAAADWIAHLSGLGVAVLIAATSIDRLCERTWWWERE